MIGSLLLIHDLYPVPLEARVEEALASVRPYMESHGGDVSCSGWRTASRTCELVGHCHGCPASAATLELAIKEALEEAAPDLLGLEVEGVAEAKPMRKPLAMAAPAAEAPATPGWLPLEEAGAVGPGRSARSRSRASTSSSRTSTAPCSPTATAAPRCDASLRDASLAGPLLMCAACGCAFDLPRAGRAAAGEEQLGPVPLLRRGGRAYEVALA